MRLSFYTYSYTDKLDMPIPECLERIARTGYSGIDVSGTHGQSDDPKSFDKARRVLTRKTAERLKLRIEAVISHAQLTDTQADPGQQPLDLKGTIDLAADLAADVVTFHMGGYHDGIPRHKTWRLAVDAIRQAADHGARKHISLAVDGIWPTWIDDSPQALQQLLNDVDSPALGANFDPCYLTLMGIDPDQFVRRFASRIVHAHLKDHIGRYPKWKHVLPGRGEMDYARVFRALSAAKFAGSAAVECFTSMKFDEACDESYAAMVAAAEKGDARFRSHQAEAESGSN